MTSTEAAPAERVPDPEFGFPDRVRKSRLFSGSTQREFAERLGVKHQTLAAWELGTTSCPRETSIAKRIEVLTGIRAAWVLGLNEPAPPPPASPQSTSEESTISGSNSDVTSAVVIEGPWSAPGVVLPAVRSA